MESIHILEPAFHTSATPLPGDRAGWKDVPRAVDLLARAEKRASGILGKLALHMLDRLHIFSAPRILHAECLAADLSRNAASHG